MAEEVGQAYVSIVPSLRGFSARVKAELASELRGIDGPVSDAGRRAGGEFGDNLREGIRTRLAGIGAMLKTGLVVGAAAAVAGLGALTAVGLRSAAALEQTQIGIEALTGSAEVAKEFLEDLQQFSAQTPFEFQGVADAARRILAFGNAIGITREEVIPTLTVIGDLVSVLGGTQENIDSVVRALGQISSKGKVSQEELLQLAEALPGFNANAAIAAATGLTVAESMEAITRGEVDAVTGINALLAGMAQFPGAAGAMELQAQTLLGVFSTFKDTIGIALTNAFQPVIPAIKDSLAELTPVLGAAIDQLAPSLGGLLSALLPVIGQLVTGLVPVLTPILDAITASLPALTGVFVPLGEAIGGILTALAPVLPILAELAASVISAIIPAVAALGPIIEALVPVLEPIADVIGAVFEALGPPIGELVTALAGLLIPVVDAFVPHLDAMLDAFLPLLPTITDLVPPLIELINAFMPLVDLFVALLPVSTALLVPLAQLTAGLIALLSQYAVIPMIKVFTAGVTALLSPLSSVVGWVESLAGWLQNIDWGKTGEAIGGAFKTAWDAAGRFLSSILDFFGGLKDKILAKLSGVRTWLVDVGRDMIQGLINGAGNLLSRIGSFLLDRLPGWLVDPFKRALGIASPSKVFAEIGEDTVAGYVQGIEDSARSATAAVTSLAPAVSGAGSTFGMATPRPVVNVVTSDPLIAALMERIQEEVRTRFGGNVDIAFGSAG